MPFTFERLAIPEIILIKPKVFLDQRGYFLETYKYSEFLEFGIKERFLQDNHSKSVRGVLRGLHFQRNPKAQGKLIRCTKGKIWDVGVDIRKGSPTYGKWVGIELSEDNFYMLYIPVGFAHGFCVLSDEAEVQYKCTEEYCAELDAGIRWDDPEINIYWPIKDPILSDKDAKLPFLRDAKNNFIYGDE
ncbi:MAG: dTDP-4-dehydrorhamnose 3,5-epimerase [Proteobacteria bacterium]|nr:dTDP-4-dehydrorhamnose 3,5-epimerase [Pseudomonadota bacterium]